MRASMHVCTCFCLLVRTSACKCQVWRRTDTELAKFRWLCAEPLLARVCICLFIYLSIYLPCFFRYCHRLPPFFGFACCSHARWSPLRAHSGVLSIWGLLAPQQIHAWCAKVTAVFCQSAIESAQKDHATVVQNMIDNRESHVQKLRMLFSSFVVLAVLC